MTQSGTEYSDTGGTTDGYRLSILDDTLTKKLPSMTFEKFVNEKNKEEDDSIIEDENDLKDLENNEISMNVTQGSYELNLNQGTPLLNKFRDPFEETPDEKDKVNFIESEQSGDKSGIDVEKEKLILFKSPSDRSNQIVKNNESNKESKFLTFLNGSTINAADQFRALKEKQGNDIGYEYEILDESNVGLVVHIRKPDYVTNEDTSLMDDSSLRLNLMPMGVRRQKLADTQDLLEATQPDGNIHEEVNNMIREQRSKQDIDNDDDDDYYLLDKDEKIDNYKEEVSLSGEFKENTDNRNDNENDTTCESITESNVESGNKKKEENGETTRATVTIVENDLKVIGVAENFEKLKNSQFTFSMSPLNETDVGQKYPLMASTQEFSESEKYNEKKTYEVNMIHKADQNDMYNNVETNDYVKETQVIDNFSQSIVIEEDEDEERKNEKNGRADYHEYEDEEGEKIKTGRNILQTFRIEDESQTEQPQSQVDLLTAIISTSQVQEVDQSQKNIHEGNYSFEIENTQISDIPETLKINIDSNESKKDNNIINNPSSPVDLMQNLEPIRSDNVDSNENTESEIPNTSTMSISKIYVDKKDNFKPLTKNINIIPNGNEDMTSTPLINNRKGFNDNVIDEKEELVEDSSDCNNKVSMIEKLNNVLRDESLGNGKFCNDTCEIEREKKIKQYTISDILECSSVFFMNSSSRIPGFITKIVKTDDVILVDLKIKDGAIIIDYSKIYAPICFDVGDSVKYSLDKRHNYVITGLKRENDIKDEKKNETELSPVIKTVDGFNKIYIKRNQKNCNEIFNEFEVNIEDIYLTAPICRNYKYKLFNDPDDFKRYIDYQISKYMMKENEEYNLNDLNPDDTLINMLGINRDNTNTNTHNNNKIKGPFNNCLFIVTGLSNSRIGSSGDCKMNTPRHQKDKDSLPKLIEFIRAQGGSVLQDVGFESIIKFRNRVNNKSFNGINISPRKVKMISMNKTEEDFKQYECLEDKGEYFKLRFKDKNYCIEFDEEFKNFEFGCVISTRHVRTLKYLQCLCLKWPIIHIEFIKRCMNEEIFLKNWKNEWTKFLLIAGECSKLNCSIGLNIFEFYNNLRNGFKLYQQVGLNDSFNGNTIIIINDDFENFKERLKFDEGFLRNKRRKLSKRVVDKVLNDNIDEDWMKRDMAEEEEEEEEEEEGEGEGEGEGEEDDESNHKNPIDGPNNVETLLWIFKHLSFDETIILKGKCNCNVKEILNDSKDCFIYIKYGSEIEKFVEIIDNFNLKRLKRLKVINWEWIVQHLIFGGFC